MRRQFNLIWIFLIGMLLSISACSDDDTIDDDDNTNPDIYESVFAGKNMLATVPSELSSNNDPKAQQTNAFVQQALSIASFSAFLEVPSTATQISGKKTVYEWTYSTYTVRYEIDENSTEYLFDVFWDVDGDGLELFMEATEAKDGRSGEMSFYADYSSNTTADYMWDWSFDSSEQLTVNFSAMNAGFETVVHINQDESGDITYYENGVKTFTAQWNSNGSGSWEDWENGSVSDSGSWS